MGRTVEFTGETFPSFANLAEKEGSFHTNHIFSTFHVNTMYPKDTRMFLWQFRKHLSIDGKFWRNDKALTSESWLRPPGDRLPRETKTLVLRSPALSASRHLSDEVFGADWTITLSPVSTPEQTNRSRCSQSRDTPNSAAAVSHPVISNSSSSPLHTQGSGKGQLRN